jgi:hypothetical protein
MWLHFVHQLVHERTHLFAVYIILTHTFFHPPKYHLTNGSIRRLNLLQLLIKKHHYLMIVFLIVLLSREIVYSGPSPLVRFTKSY